MNSPLAKLMPTMMDAERVKREGWRNEHILVIHVNDTRIDWMESELIRQIGNRLYGKGDHGQD